MHKTCSIPIFNPYVSLSLSMCVCIRVKYIGVCVYTCICLYMVVTSHRFDFLSALVLPYKYCLPTNFLFVVQAEQNNASCRENIFESQSPSCTVLSGRNEKKVLRKRTKNAVGKPNRQGSTSFK